MKASLNDKLGSVKWGNYKMGELFQRIETNKLPYKADELPNRPMGKYTLPCLTSSFNNQGLNYFAPRHGATILKNVITIPSNSDVYRAYYQSRDFTVLSDAYAITWILDDREVTSNQYLFMVMCINKVTDLPIYSYKNKLGGWNVVKNKYIQLPQRNGKIDFDFMESFIAELEAERVAELSAYLTVSGLDNYELSSDEENALKNYQSLKWDTYNLENLFGKSTRGKRLKGDDRIAGMLPFVTAGEAAEGISAYISNEVEVFEKNTTTIDMFGSAKYRNYKYGADDHVAVVHTEAVPMKASIFLTSAIHKAAHTGKFDYGHNFYAKDADALDIMLPTKDGKPDYDAMATLISAVQKLIIKDVVLYADRKIEKTKEVTKRPDTE
ncbi:MAG: restriction endonuclease subunit S [Clostridia bacterium]|nr:restriction endonuclease subunit S [Clostridia bacterium]